MAEKMLGDVLYAASMSQLIDNNQNLQMDLLARAFGEDFFNSYIDGNYDSSADYWKLTKEGNLAYDGKATLVDENGNVIKSYKEMGLKSEDSIESALINILGINQNDKNAVEKVRKMMASVYGHSFSDNSEDWKWGSKNEILYQDGLLFGKYPKTAFGNLTDYNMDKEITLGMIDNLFNDIGATDKQKTQFIKTVYNNPINLLNYTDMTDNSKSAIGLLNSIYSSKEMDIIQYNKTYYNNVLKNGQNIENTMYKDVEAEHRRTTDFDEETGYIKLASSSVAKAVFLSEQHPAFDEGAVPANSSIYSPGGYWQFLGSDDHKAWFQLFGSDVNMRIQHLNPEDITQTRNSIYGSSSSDYKLFNYPTESFGSGSGPHSHVEFTRLLPYNGRAYVAQYVNPNTFQPGSRIEYYINYYDSNKKLLEQRTYARTFGR